MAINSVSGGILWESCRFDAMFHGKCINSAGCLFEWLLVPLSVRGGGGGGGGYWWIGGGMGRAWISSCMDNLFCTI